MGRRCGRRSSAPGALATCMSGGVAAGGGVNGAEVGGTSPKSVAWGGSKASIPPTSAPFTPSPAAIPPPKHVDSASGALLHLMHLRLILLNLIRHVQN